MRKGKEKPVCGSCKHGIEIVEAKKNHQDYMSLGMTYCLGCSRNAVSAYLRPKDTLSDMYDPVEAKDGRGN